MSSFVVASVLLLARIVFGQASGPDCSLLSAADVAGVLGEPVVANVTFGCEYDSLPGASPFKVIRFIPGYPSGAADFQSAARRVAQDNDGLATFAAVDGVGDEAYTWHDALGETRLDLRSGSQAVEIFVDLGVFGTRDVPARTSVAIQLGNLAVAHLAGGAAAAATAATSGAAASEPIGAGGAVSEDLTFSGALSGYLSVGRRGDTYVCAGGNLAPPAAATVTSNAALAIGPIVGDLGGQQVQMSVTKLGYTGPGTYDAAGVGFDVGGNHYYQVRGLPGVFSVDASGRGGTLQMDLAANGDPTTVVGQVQGGWQCPADAF